MSGSLGAEEPLHVEAGTDREPVSTLEALNSLDQDEVLEGYRDGLKSERIDAAPGGNRSRSYWHGWRNARVDRRFCEPDEAQCLLAAAVVAEARVNQGSAT